MNVHAIKLPKTQCFACTEKDVRGVFDRLGLDWISFGKNGKSFEFDHRCHHRPKIKGKVVAELCTSSNGSRYLSIFPISTIGYDDLARNDFVQNVLPQLKSWLAEKLGRPETSPDGYECMIVDWDGQTHNTYEVRFLTG